MTILMEREGLVRIFVGIVDYRGRELAHCFEEVSIRLPILTDCTDEAEVPCVALRGYQGPLFSRLLLCPQTLSRVLQTD